MQIDPRDKRDDQTNVASSHEHEPDAPRQVQGVEQQSRQPEDLGAIETVRLKTIQVLSERIRLLGIARSGAYEHYNLQLANGFPVPPGEVAILDFVRRYLPNLRSYHEIGSGLGTLPLILAYEGFASVGIERDDRRNLTATTILRELATDFPHIEGNCRLIGAAFPDAVIDLDVSDSMAILTDFVSTQAPRDYIRLCHALARYRYVLLDLQRFCSKRESEDEELRLVEELISHGLSPRDQCIALGNQGNYRLFESMRAGELRQLSADPAGNVGAAFRQPETAISPVHQRSMQLTVAAASAEVQVGPETALAIREPTEVSTELRSFSLPPLPSKARHKRFGGWLGVSALLVIGIPSILAIIYYGFFASRQYVTSFQFAVRGLSQAAAGRVSGSASMGGAGAMSPDSFVVTDYINSPQAITDVERTLDVRALFSKLDIDFWSRLPADATREELNVYWARMVSARFDLISGNVLVSVRAFTPQDSLTLTETIIAKADEMFRGLNTRAQHDMVRIADDNVNRSQAQLNATSRALVEFRQTSGMVDPSKTAAAGAAIVDDLRKQLSTLQGQFAAIKATAPNSPTLSSLSFQISAIEGQIRKEDPLAPSLVKSVSAEKLAHFQSLELERQSAERLYGEAISLKNQAYLVAQNQQSYLALFVAPTLPQASLYPNRTRSIITVIFAVALAWFVGVLIIYALRDHLM